MQESSDSPAIPAQVLSERTHLVIPSLPHWIEPAVDFLRQKAILCGACHEPRAAKLFVALLEALSNAVIHGNLEISSALKEQGDDSFARALVERTADPILSARVVDIAIDYDGECCRWVITDEGRGFDVERVLQRCLSDDPEVMLASGRGILMMHAFVDAVRYDMDGRRLTISLERRSGEEKRREPRAPVHRPFRVTPVRPDGSPDWSAAYDAVSRDFSAHGMALIQDNLTEGQNILVGITTGGETVYVPAQVRHCRTIAAGCVELGCEFHMLPDSGAAVSGGAEQVREVHQAILDVLALHQAPQGSSQERRTYPRVVFNQAVAVETAGHAAVTGYARDLSKGGMSLIARVAMPLTPAVVVLPRPAASPLRIRARVVRCNRIQEGFYDVGLQFVRLDAAPGQSTQGDAE